MTHNLPPAVEWSKSADALYVLFQDRPSARTQTLDDIRLVDWADDGSLVGVEFLYVSDGVDLRGVPAADQVARVLRDLHGVRVVYQDERSAHENVQPA